MDLNILTTVGSFGLGGGIAIYLVWWITKQFSKQMDNNTAAMNAIANRLNNQDARLSMQDLKLDRICDALGRIEAK